MSPSYLHRKAFLTNFEIACEAGILALLADMLWVVHDVLANGMSIWYFVIFLGLFLGNALTVFALCRHHRYYTHRLINKNKRKGYSTTFIQYRA